MQGKPFSQLLLLGIILFQGEIDRSQFIVLFWKCSSCISCLSYYKVR